MRTDDKLISGVYGDPLLRRPGRISPYERYPERSAWTESEIRERPDGTRYKVTRHAARWAGTSMREPWGAPVEVLVD